MGRAGHFELKLQVGIRGGNLSLEINKGQNFSDRSPVGDRRRKTHDIPVKKHRVTTMSIDLAGRAPPKKVLFKKDRMKPIKIAPSRINDVNSALTKAASATRRPIDQTDL